MANGVEETVYLKLFLLACHGIFDTETLEEIAVTETLSCDRIPENSLEQESYEHDGQVKS